MQEAFTVFFLVILWVGEKKPNNNNGENSEEIEIIEKKTISTLDRYQQQSVTFI